jgi:hypothetical protein
LLGPWKAAARSDWACHCVLTYPGWVAPVTNRGGLPAVVAADLHTPAGSSDRFLNGLMREVASPAGVGLTTNYWVHDDQHGAHFER